MFKHFLRASGGAAGAIVDIFEFVGFRTFTGVTTPSYPATTEKNDIAIFFCMVDTTTGAGSFVPAGYTTLISTTVGTNYQYYVGYKLLDGTEGGQNLTASSQQSNNNRDMVLATYRTLGGLPQLSSEVITSSSSPNGSLVFDMAGLRLPVIFISILDNEEGPTALNPSVSTIGGVVNTVTTSFSRVLYLIHFDLAATPTEGTLTTVPVEAVDRAYRSFSKIEIR